MPLTLMKVGSGKFELITGPFEKALLCKAGHVSGACRVFKAKTKSKNSARWNMTIKPTR